MIYDAVATWVLALGVAAIIFGTSELGYRLASRMPEGSLADQPVSVVASATFTLVGLILAFTFSMALNRFEQRRDVTVREANAIGTTVLRTRLLDAASEAAMRDELRRYLAARIAFAAGETRPEVRDRAEAASSALQQSMWRRVTEAARRDPRSTELPLLVASLNETIDVAGEQSAVLTAPLPEGVLLVDLVLVIAAAFMMGLGFGRSRQRSHAANAVFAVVLALAFALILDLDRPQRGFIRVNLEPLYGVQQLVNGEP